MQSNTESQFNVENIIINKGFTSLSIYSFVILFIIERVCHSESQLPMSQYNPIKS